MFDLSRIPVLETQRLILRRIEERDLDAMAAIYADPEVMRFLDTSKPRDRAGTWRSLAFILGHWALRGFGLFAVEEKGTGHLVGRVGLFEPEGWPETEIGWTLGRAH